MKRIILVLSLVCCMAGCALTTEQVNISYPPQTTAKIPDAQHVVVNVVLNDARIDKSNKVSCKKNGFGFEMAPILATEDVTVTIRRAIETELKNRGFLLGSKANVSIIGELNRFYNDHKIGFFAGDAIAELNMNVEVKNSDGSVVYTRSIAAQGVEENTQLATGNNAKLALNKALVNGLKLLFEDQKFLAALLAANAKPAS